MGDPIVETGGGTDRDVPPVPVVPSDDVLRALLAGASTIAVVGLSSKPGRPALDIATFLQGRGYRILPVHPREAEVLGERVYPSLLDIPRDEPIDIVDVFLRAEQTPPVARDAVAIGANALWLQQDIVSEEAGMVAAAGGLTVIMGICIKQTIMRLEAAKDERHEQGEPS